MAIALAEMAQSQPPAAPNVAAPTPTPVATVRPVVSPHEQSTVVKAVAAAEDAGGEAEDDAAIASATTIEDAPSTEFNEAAESAFLAEAKDRGEVVGAKSLAEVEESNPKALPPLDEMVNKIPPEVREALEDLFRARFVTVKRFPKRALKQ